MNVWHFRTAEPDLSDDFEGGLDWLHAFYTSIRALYPTSVTITLPIDAVDVSQDPPQSRGFVARQITGLGSSLELPELLAICASWKTTFRTRRGMGRTFIGPLSRDALEGNGTPAPSFAEAVTTAGRALIAAGSNSDGNGAWGVYSRMDGLIRDFVDVAARTDQFSYLSSRRD